MSGLQVEMITTGGFVVVASIVVMLASQVVARAINNASWGKLGLPLRPSTARMGIIGAGMVGFLVGAAAIVLALTTSPS